MTSDWYNLVSTLMRNSDAQKCTRAALIFTSASELRHYTEEGGCINWSSVPDASDWLLISPTDDNRKCAIGNERFKLFSSKFRLSGLPICECCGKQLMLETWNKKERKKERKKEIEKESKKERKKERERKRKKFRKQVIFRAELTFLQANHNVS